MRERHWKMLMQATGQTFVMDNNFCLGDLLALGLHQHVDACSEIVDRAQKELAIEKQIKKICDTWSGLTLSFAPYQDGDVMQVQVGAALSHPSVGGTAGLKAQACMKDMHLLNCICA